MIIYIPTDGPTQDRLMTALQLTVDEPSRNFAELRKCTSLCKLSLSLRPITAMQMACTHRQTCVVFTNGVGDAVTVVTSQLALVETIERFPREFFSTIFGNSLATI